MIPYIICSFRGGEQMSVFSISLAEWKIAIMGEKYGD